jgi:hypothetical protein
MFVCFVIIIDFFFLSDPYKVYVHVQAVECGNTSWEVKVPEYHVKCTVYHVDALQMAGVIKSQGGQLPIGKLFLCYFVF